MATVRDLSFHPALPARLGTQFCPDRELPVEAQTRDELASISKPNSRRGDLLLLAPIVESKRVSHRHRRMGGRHGYQGIPRGRKIFATGKPSFRLDRFGEHDVEIVVGVSRKVKPRDMKLVDEALKLGHGTLFAG